MYLRTYLQIHTLLDRQLGQSSCSSPSTYSSGPSVSWGSSKLNGIGLSNTKILILMRSDHFLPGEGAGNPNHRHGRKTAWIRHPVFGLFLG